MKKIIGFILAICFILPSAFLMSACGDNTTDIAYIHFETNDSDYKVLYYSDASDQIFVVPSASTSTSDYILKINFSKWIQPQTIDGKETLCVDIEDWTTMTITIKDTYWSENKKIYLNGKDITEKKIEVSGPTSGTANIVYRFEDFGLVKGNTDEFVNTISYALPPV